MAQHVYSYNGSHLHIRMDEKLANAYNRAMDAWFQAQRDFERINGRKITPTEIMQGKLLIRASKDEAEAWNKVAKFVTKQIEGGLVLTEEECTSDYLVKL